MTITAAYITPISACCCKRNEADCDCENVISSVNLPDRVVVKWQWQSPEIGKCLKKCNSQAYCNCTCNWCDPNFVYCQGPDNVGVAPPNSCFYVDPWLSGGLCDSAGCAKFNSNPTESPQCVSCWPREDLGYLGHGMGVREEHLAVLRAGSWSGCYSDCGNVHSECEDNNCAETYALSYGGSASAIGISSVVSNPIIDFLEGGEAHLKRYCKSTYPFGNGIGPIYTWDHEYYEEVVADDTVEWGESPALFPVADNNFCDNYRTNLYVLKNMYNTVRVGNCWIPGNVERIEPVGFYNCPRPGSGSDIGGSSATITASIELVQIDGFRCGWKFSIGYNSEIGHHSDCSLGSEMCGDRPASTDEECPCSGKRCNTDGGCFDHDDVGETMCCYTFNSIHDPDGLRNNDGGPCDLCGGGGCCGCQRAAADSPCIYWGEGQAGANHFTFLQFKTLYTPENNYDCFRSPFDSEAFDNWVGPDGSVTTPNAPDTGYNIDWNQAQTPRAFWSQNYANLAADDLTPTCMPGAAENFPLGPGMGMLHITGFVPENDDD